MRVFYLTHTDTAQRLQETATLTRSMTGIRRLFTYSPLRALVLRGTADQLALTQRLITERHKP